MPKAAKDSRRKFHSSDPDQRIGFPATTSFTLVTKNYTARLAHALWDLKLRFNLSTIFLYEGSRACHGLYGFLLVDLLGCKVDAESSVNQLQRLTVTPT